MGGEGKAHLFTELGERKLGEVVGDKDRKGKLSSSGAFSSRLKRQVCLVNVEESRHTSTHNNHRGFLQEY